MKTNTALEELSVYRQAERLDASMLYLDSNEGRGPGADFVRDSLAEISPSILARYPNSRALETIIGERYGLEPGNVLVTAGGDAALEACCRIALSPGRDALYAVPTFEMLERYVRLTGAAPRTVPWEVGPYPVEEILRRKSQDTSLVAAVTPNNPLGCTASGESLCALCDAFPDAVVVNDLAYVEFAAADPTELLLRYPNALVVRTFSKAWGLAGLRVGYILGHESLIGCLRKVAPPYGVSTVSLMLAERWLEEGERSVREFVTRVKNERAILTALLAGLGARVTEGSGNFVFARFDGAAAVFERLRRNGIVVRRFNSPGLLDGLRITCPGDDLCFRRLTAALQISARS